MSELNYASLAKTLGIKEGRISGEQLVTNCPLHNDKRPSFSLNTKTGLWTCFSRDGSGSFTQLVSKVNGCNIAQAHDWVLQASALMPVLNPGAAIKEEAALYDLYWLYHFNSLNRDVMPQWWFDRGFTWDTADAWDIRYDNMHAQLCIPFYKHNPPKKKIDHYQYLFGTITRNFKREPKYRNSRELPRSDYLFGLTAQAGKLLILCEGPLDALWLWQNGYPSAALLGLNLSQEHIRLLRNIPEICLAFDNDESGQIAKDVIRYEFMQAGRTFSQITQLKIPPEYKDIGEIRDLQELAETIGSRKAM